MAYYALLIDDWLVIELWRFYPFLLAVLSLFSGCWSLRALCLLAVVGWTDDTLELLKLAAKGKSDSFYC